MQGDGRTLLSSHFDVTPLCHIASHLEGPSIEEYISSHILPALAEQNVRWEPQSLQLCLSRNIPLGRRQAAFQVYLARRNPKEVCSSSSISSMTIVSQSMMQPLHSITLCPILHDESSTNGRTMDVRTHPLLRSCVKRLLVGRKVFYPASMMHTEVVVVLHVKVPSQRYDSNEMIWLSYQVRSVQPPPPPSNVLFVILPSTRILFSTPTPTDTTIPSISIPISSVSIPTSYLLQSLQSILTFHNEDTTSNHPPSILLSRSFLFSGPPGVGKTYAVQQAISIANSWLVPTTKMKNHTHNTWPIQLISIRGSELLASAGGHAARELEQTFRRGAQLCDMSPTKAVVIFLDECDALISSSMAVAAMLAMLLDTMDDVSKNNGWARLLVVAATNRIDAIPSFLRRPGRFEKEVVVNPPDAEERYLLLKQMLNGKFEKDNGKEDELESFANMCVGYVAADLAAVVRKASLICMDRWLLCHHDETSIEFDTPSMTIQDLIDATNYIGASCLRDASLSAPPKTTWEEIAGDVGGAKQALQQAIEWPRTRKVAFKALGLAPPRGVLLHGPPGCAKTTLARAAAGSAGVAFLSLSPADVYSSSYVGEAESVVRRAFDLARSAAPCVLFFDEIDSIIGGDDSGGGGGSGHGMNRGSSSEARVLSTFLNEMDGVDGSIDDGVLVLGATNRPGTLDAALLRPGRFDKIIYVPPPDESCRKEILMMECKKWYDFILMSNGDSFGTSDDALEKVFGLNNLAADDTTGSMTGAELVGACREAAMGVIRNELMHNPVGSKMLQTPPVQILQSLKRELEVTLQKTTPLLSNATVLEEYNRFEEEYKS